MRAALPVLFILCLSVAAEDAKVAEAKKPTLAESLERERRGDFEDSTQDVAEQIDAARDRFYEYYSKTDEDDDKQAIKDAFHVVTQRILERARQQLREAEERLDRALERLERKEPSGKSERV